MTLLLKKLGQLPAWQFILIVFLLLFVVVVPLSALVEIFDFDVEANTPVRDVGMLFSIVFSCILIPLLETYCLQYLPIYLTDRFISKNWSLQIVISAVIFGALHYYNPLYIVFGILNGLVLGAGFSSRYHMRGFKAAFWSIAFVHGLRNLIGVITAAFDTGNM